MTKSDSEKTLREKELAFFGTITASISHDLANAIATIEQTAGLLEDLILGSDGKRPIPNEQLQKISDRIGKQTKRGAVIVRRLNAFSHSVDVCEKEIELNEVAQTVAHLARRMAERKRVGIEVRDGSVGLRVLSSPFHVQQVIYVSLQQVVSATSQGRDISLSPAEHEGLPSLWIASRSLDSAVPPDLSYAEVLMTRLGGNLQLTFDENLLEIGLIFQARNQEFTNDGDSR